jgi:hypothetical protein
MTTVVNNPGNNNGSSGVWIAVLVIVIIALVLIFGIPALRGSGGGSAGVNVQATVPSGASQ